MFSKVKCQNILETSGGRWNIKEPSYRKYFSELLIIQENGLVEDNDIHI